MCFPQPDGTWYIAGSNFGLEPPPDWSAKPHRAPGCRDPLPSRAHPRDARGCSMLPRAEAIVAAARAAVARVPRLRAHRQAWHPRVPSPAAGRLMPSTLPVADPAPAHGGLPASAVAGRRRRATSASTCTCRSAGCAAGTATSTPTRATSCAGAKPSDYAGQADRRGRARGRRARDRRSARRPARTVFFGGGTPTLLPVTDLAAMLAASRAPGASRPAPRSRPRPTPTRSTRSTSLAARAPPDSPGSQLRHAVGGAARARHARAHPRPGAHPARGRSGRAQAGLQVSLDLIYGTPGESLDDWRRSVDARARPARPTTSRPTRSSSRRAPSSPRRSAAASSRRPTTTCRPTCTSSRMQRSTAAGYDWYEVSNWARDPASRSRHNLAYWLGHDWWGVGPGAHSHVGGVRWWNVKHPAAYADRIASGVSPGGGREMLDDEHATTERVLLRARIRDGLPVAELAAARPHRGRRPHRRRARRRPRAALGGSSGADPTRAAAGGRRRAAPADAERNARWRSVHELDRRAGRCTSRPVVRGHRRDDAEHDHQHRDGDQDEDADHEQHEDRADHRRR